MSVFNSALLCLMSYLGKDKVQTAEVLTEIFELFKDVKKNPSKTDDSGSEKQ